MVKKVFADDKGMVVFHCSRCGKSQKEQAEPFRQVKGPIRIECDCGNAYEVKIEFRASFRKGTDLEGLFSSVSLPGTWMKMRVKDLSFDGCGFETLGANPLRPGDTIRIEFALDNAKKSKIKKAALVRSVKGQTVGCQFDESPGAFDPDLGFYLR
ncbi:MAG: PilZ domain-containing protein [Thermodesulfobacteriota bacterium]